MSPIMHRIAKDAEIGDRLADKLFKVHAKDGQEAWLLIHVEIQGRPEAIFSERMYTYNYRAFDLYHKKVVSLAVLCDEDPDWKPDRFSYNVWGCEACLRFLVVKLLEYREREHELEADPNPFAAVVLAQLKTIETRDLPQERQRWKVRLVRSLYDRGLGPNDVQQLFRLIDWMLVLPTELDAGFRDEIDRFEQERKMPYVTSVERLGRKEGLKIGRQQGRKQGRQQGRKQGRREGLLEGIEIALELKFDVVDTQLMDEIRALKDIEQLRKVAGALKKAKTVNQIRAMLEA